MNAIRQGRRPAFFHLSWALVRTGPRGCGCFAAILLFAAATTGCAFRQSVRLDLDPIGEDLVSRIIIEDARDAEARSTRLEGEFGHCARIYGDRFIEPSKLVFLRTLLAERLTPSFQLVVRLERFDTIEHCNRSQRTAVRGAVSGALRGVWFPEDKEGGDDFELRIEGAANGVPFRFSRRFEYNDIGFLNFPSESPEYRRRIGDLFAAFAVELKKVVTGETSRAEQTHGASGSAAQDATTTAP